MKLEARVLLNGDIVITFGDLSKSFGVTIAAGSSHEALDIAAQQLIESAAGFRKADVVLAVMKAMG